MNQLVNLLNEIGMLAHTPRSGFAFLGTGDQSVAEHSYRVALIAFFLADLYKESSIDKHKLVMLCLFHDLPEARTGDLNYVNKLYVEASTPRALKDIEQGSENGSIVGQYVREYEERKSVESKLAHDADQLELMLVLKKELDTGNPRAKEWMVVVRERIKTEVGKRLAEEIEKTPFDEWWLKHVRAK